MDTATVDPEDTVKLLSAILAGVPRLPRAACVGRSELYDELHGGYHRLKHEGGWTLHQPQPGLFRWTSRLGHTDHRPSSNRYPIPSNRTNYPGHSLPPDDGWEDTQIWEDTPPEPDLQPESPTEPNPFDDAPPF
ncbi:MAG: hypothetical protein ACRDRO_00285 [Pseudonocardiaceae bacterium]